MTPDRGEREGTLSYYAGSTDPTVWKQPTQSYAPGELWPPLAHYVNGWERRFHELMLHDSVRMDAYRSAIDLVVGDLVRKRCESGQKTLRVIDVGAGYGILSYWVAESFEKHCSRLAEPGERVPLKLRVYAVEGNPITAGEAHRRLYLEKMAFTDFWEPDGPEISCGSKEQTVLVCHTTSYQLREYLEQHASVTKAFDPSLFDNHSNGAAIFLRVDLVVSEIFGALGDTEDGVAILANIISNHLKSDGLVIPRTITSYLQPVRSTPRGPHERLKRREFSFLSNAYEIPTDDIYNFCYDVIIPDDALVGVPLPVHTWKFGPDSESIATWSVAYQKILLFPTERKESIVGLKGYFEMLLAEVSANSVRISLRSADIQSRMTSDCWKHLFLPIERPLNGPAGFLEVRLERHTEYVVNSVENQRSLQREPMATYQWELGFQGTSSRESQQYRTVRPFYPRQESHLRLAVKRLCEMVEQQVAGQLLPHSDEAAEVLLKEALIGLRGMPRREQPLLDRFFMSWPSNFGGALWFEVQVDAEPDSELELRRIEGIAQKLDAQGLILRYSVKGSEPNLKSEEYWNSKVVEDRSGNLGDDFVSVVVIPAREALAATPSQMREIETAIFLLHARILSQLLVNEYERSGRGKQARAVEHEVGQVAGLLRVGPGYIIQPVEVYEEWMASATVEEKEEIASVLKTSGVISALGETVRAASSYLDLISESKTAVTPLDAVVGKPLPDALEAVVALAKRASFAYWIRRFGTFTAGSHASLLANVKRERSYVHEIEQRNLLKIFFGAEVKNLCVPLSPDPSILGASKSSLPRAEKEQLLESMGRKILKLWATMVLSSMKHSWGGESTFATFDPVAIDLRMLGFGKDSNLTFVVWNRVPKDLIEFNDRRWASKGKQVIKQITAEVLVEALRDANLGVRYEGLKWKPNFDSLTKETPELAEFLGRHDDYGLYYNRVDFFGPTLKVFTPEPTEGEDDHEERRFDP